jgi:hypothetical protein
MENLCYIFRAFFFLFHTQHTLYPETTTTVNANGLLVHIDYSHVILSALLFAVLQAAQNNASGTRQLLRSLTVKLTDPSATHCFNQGQKRLVAIIFFSSFRKII